MTSFKYLGRLGTFCGVLAMLAFTTGCPFAQDACDGFDVDDDNPCTTDSCDFDDNGDPVAVNTPIEDCCQTAADCNDNNACTIDACSDIDDTGAGNCTNTAVGQNCCNDADECDAGEVCTNNQCVPACDSDDDCEAGQVCNTTTGQCEDAPECTTGGDCDDGDACTNDVCTDGVCSNPDVTCGAGQVCVDGECVGECTEDVDCPDDGDACTEVACVDGGCVTTTTDCNDDVACTDDSCDPDTGDCVNEDNCVDGTCDPDTGECTGCTADVDCDDDDDCTTDTCVDGSCENTNNTGACSDGNACTTNDTCANGACAGTAVTCPAGQQCNATTGNCQAIVCDDNTDCNDNASCTTDICNLATGVCEYTAINTACEDNQHCTGPAGTDVCDPDDADAEAGTGCVRQGNPCVNPLPICQESNDTCIGCTTNAQCDDGFSCTSDTCAAGSCNNTALNTSCPDPVKCDGDDICDPNNADANEATGCYAPGNPCAPRVCNEATYVVGDPNTCENCTSNASCTDGVACTEDTCNGVLGTCANVPNNTLCPDPLFCNGDDICDPNDPDAGVDGCVNGLPAYPCANACNETTNTCFNCTANLDCSDGIACTTDTCNGGTGLCSHADNCALGTICNVQNGQCE